MPVYERVVDGRVVESIDPGQHPQENARLMAAAVDPATGWRRVLFQAPGEDPLPVDTTPPQAPPRIKPQPRPAARRPTTTKDA